MIRSWKELIQKLREEFSEETRKQVEMVSFLVNHRSEENWCLRTEVSNDNKKIRAYIWPCPGGTFSLNDYPNLKYLKIEDKLINMKQDYMYINANDSSIDEHNIEQMQNSLLELTEKNSSIPFFLVLFSQYNKIVLVPNNYLFLKRFQEIEELKERVNRLEEKTNALHKIAELIIPHQTFNLPQLTAEIARLKIQDLITQLANQQTQLQELITDAKSKIGANLENIFNLLLQTQKQIVEQENDNALSHAQLTGQLTAFGTLLQEKLSQLEIQALLDKQKQVTQLESQITNLQNQENTQNWTNLHLNFTQELIQTWQNHNFAYQQTQEWINIGLLPTDHAFCAWLRDTKHLTSEQVLNESNLEQLKIEYQTSQQVAQIQHNN